MGLFLLFIFHDAITQGSRIALGQIMPDWLGTSFHPCATPPTAPAWCIVEVDLSWDCGSSLHHENLLLHISTAIDVNDQLSDRWVFSDVIKELSRTMNEARHSFYGEFVLVSLSKYSQKVHLA